MLFCLLFAVRSAKMHGANLKLPVHCQLCSQCSIPELSSEGIRRPTADLLIGKPSRLGQAICTLPADPSKVINDGNLKL